MYFRDSLEKHDAHSVFSRSANCTQPSEVNDLVLTLVKVFILSTLLSQYSKSLFDCLCLSLQALYVVN